MTSHGSRRDCRTLPACRSVASSTSCGAERASSSKRLKPSRTSLSSGQRSISARVWSLQCCIRSDKGRNGCGRAGERHMRRSKPAITRSCSVSGSTRNAVPGSQRSMRIAPRSSSNSKRRTVGFPSQNRSPCASCFPSVWGIPNFRTANVPSARLTGATHAQLTSAPSNGSSSVSDHRRKILSKAKGKWSSQAARAGVLRQFAAS